MGFAEWSEAVAERIAAQRAREAAKKEEAAAAAEARAAAAAVAFNAWAVDKSVHDRALEVRGGRPAPAARPPPARTPQ